jgi:hypothetical protein
LGAKQHIPFDILSVIHVNIGREVFLATTLLGSHLMNIHFPRGNSYPNRDNQNFDDSRLYVKALLKGR